MSIVALTGARVFDGDALQTGMAVLVEDGRVTGIVPHADLPRGTRCEALEGGILAPGFVDLQVNGGGGRMLNDAPTVQTLEIMAEAHARLGATTILPTLITARPDATRAAIDAVAEAVASGMPGIAGLHLEGPHLAGAKAGAHDPALIRPMTGDDLEQLIGAAARLPCLKVTLAPEAATPDQIRALAGAGAIVALGHSECTCDAAQAAAEAGARIVTHLFNAMSQMTARAPGLVGAALADGRLSAGLIADLIHVDPAAIRVALAAKAGPGQIFLVSDAMAPAGTDMSGFDLGGRPVRRQGGRLTLADGTLAGADLDLPRAVRNLVAACDVAPERALAMASAVPGELIGGGAGRIVSGARADLVHLDDDLTLRAVWRGGIRLR